MGRHLITGGAGFIAVNLIARLLTAGDEVLALDNLSRGCAAHWRAFEGDARFRRVTVDCADAAAVREALTREGAFGDVWHLAANSDIPAGVGDPGIDLKDTFLTTFATLLAMRDHAIPTLNFASSSAVYGDKGEARIHEDIGALEPISNYGAMKLASEAQIRAAVESQGCKANIFRFPNVVGAPATHGVILDFVQKLKGNPGELEVLGNGSQKKAYLHVDDLVDAMLFIRAHAPGRFNVYNIGPPDDGVFVREIAEAVRDRVAPTAAIRYGDGDRGWVGDVPRFRYATDRLAALGWRPRLSSAQAVARAVDQIAAQEQRGG